MNYEMGDIDIAWCPGCGNYGILRAIKQTLSELEIKTEDLVVVSGIGQAAKLPQYLRCNYFNGLHGRPLPAAFAIKVANPGLNVIVTSGDGDIYGEGGNHFIHAIRRNPNITLFVHDNMVYGLTKGQASPTSAIGFKTNIQLGGVAIEPFNPISVAIALNASFVARAFIGDAKESADIFKKAIKHKGFALVDIFQPCVTYNKVNTFKWFKDNTYYLDSSYNPLDRNEAFKIAMERDKLALGVIYVNNDREIFEDKLSVYKDNKEPLYMRTLNKENLQVSILERR
ncbi:MAG TPA: 2-oxoacid ferredoxin oxidoreductase [Candidatus Margulisbacteria bacterium]|nr:MAG: 2-oxoacid ferredoxin oxidoreductase [Candidatus Margulisbacteria bacterium GWD2_39_127]OGI04406.1 MAG: 2-oxoacid ferredoxin oxidoreductase [Candidatus Margulisbacteria bacterium GWF2_38_17]OGI07340.1 MAG: 2-oxoacid ferredoxin oxidoreductase [Candidatus Margulisbacteria bacterium GWE2_39_32]HAR62857.1 2-oxoacid ferredoxin oxidoreductase [Candidatus Margulisiibacteriota bacterium]HCT86007.1 2-oxoacid ferredoxin oxidoreductase [Candidatus Margulisiibacteriota bacterium]